MNPPVMSPRSRNRYFFAAALIPIIAVLAISIFTDQSGKAQEARPEGAPQYQIFDLGVVQTGDTSSQGFGVSAGGVAVGRSLRTGGAQAFSWTQAGGRVALPNLAGRAFAVANAANDNGVVVGTGATTAFGSGRLPLIWQNGVVSQLPLPAGETLGDANDVNSLGAVAGSVNAGSLQRAAVFTTLGATVITQTTAGGSFFTTAFGINDSGRVVGTGIDPANAARNVGMVYDVGQASAIEVGALPGANGALAFGVSNSGFVTGSSMMNQGSGLPFRWSQAGGMVAVPLPTGTTQGSGRAVNSNGWVVGTASSAFAIPFLWNGTTTYRLADLIPAGTGWDLSTNTSSSALGISDSGVIVGTGVLNGAVRAYAMVPVGVPTPTPTPTPTPSPTPATLISFSDATYREDESQSAFIRINRSGVTTGSSVVSFTSLSPPSIGAAATGGAACGIGVDYITTFSVVTFAAGETSKFVTVPLCGDIVADTDESVVLSLLNPVGAGLGNLGGLAVLRINDTANQFRNTAAISMLQGTASNPYPSSIFVAGATANTFRIRVTLYDLYHDRPDNIDVLLVGPNGAKYVLMADVGGLIPVFPPNDVTLTLADYPNSVLPDAGPLVTGIFKPTTCETPVTAFPPPAPGTPYVEPGCVVARTNAQTLFGHFGGSTANGTWSLYIRDDNGLARPEETNAPTIIPGEVRGGWGLELLPSTASGVEISGRVTTPDGRGLRGAIVTVTDSQGGQRTAVTGSFGFYRFEDVEAGSSVVIGVASRRYRFASRVVQVVDSMTDVDLTALE